MRQGFDHNHRQYRQNNDHNHKAGNQRDHARYCPHFGFNQLTQRTTIAARGYKQHHIVLNRTGQYHADQNPNHARQITHLRGQHRTDQGAGAGNRGEMVAKQHDFIGRDIIHPIIVPKGRGHARAVYLQHFIGNIQTVKTIGDQIHTDRRGQHPHRIDGLATIERRVGKGCGANDGDQAPDEFIGDA